MFARWPDRSRVHERGCVASAAPALVLTSRRRGRLGALAAAAIISPSRLETRNRRTPRVRGRGRPAQRHVLHVAEGPAPRRATREAGRHTWTDFDGRRGRSGATQIARRDRRTTMTIGHLEWSRSSRGARWCAIRSSARGEDQKVRSGRAPYAIRVPAARNAHTARPTTCAIGP